MCGIAGIISPGQSLQPEHIAAMCDVIPYRGPDDYGYLAYQTRGDLAAAFKSPLELKNQSETSPDVLLGHRRLSILDLSEHGRQPFTYADGRLWMVYNGEVYNYLEIREELKHKGHRFRTETDTEVILAAYLEWGEKCLERFNGMWAFAILDTADNMLFCARDRLGIKPFYFSFGDGRFSFSSEIKQLLQLPWMEIRRNDAAFFDYLGYRVYGGNTDETYFQNIFQLQRGHYVRIPIGDTLRSLPTPVKWWDIDLDAVQNPGDAAAAETYRELLTDAIRLRLRADVPIGTCLSGGLDSSGIVCLTDRLIREKNPAAIQKTFTATSEDPRLDEREYAQAVIDATRVEPHFTKPTAESLLKSVEKLVWHHDEPFISTSIFAGWKVFELVRQSGVTVTLDGQGPDEMLGGYFTSMLEARMAEDLVHGHFITFLRDFKSRQDLFKVPMDRLVKLVLLEIPGMHRFKRHAGDMSAAEKLLTPDFFRSGLAQSTYIDNEQANLAAISGRGTLFNRRMYQQTMQGSLPGILRNVDRNSMAFSVESRVPFLDHRLVEFSFSLPADMKIRKGSSKWIYREAMKDVLPPKVLNRRSKIGFATAEELWIKGAGRNLFQEVFANIPQEAPYRREEAGRLLTDFLNDKRPFDSMLWRIFNSELWHRRYLSGEGTKPPKPAESTLSTNNAGGLAV